LTMGVPCTVIARAPQKRGAAREPRRHGVARSATRP